MKHYTLTHFGTTALILAAAQDGFKHEDDMRKRQARSAPMDPPKSRQVRRREALLLRKGRVPADNAR